MRRVEDPVFDNLNLNVLFLRERFTSPLPLSTGPGHRLTSFVELHRALKKCCSRGNQNYIYDFFFWDGRQFLACNFHTTSNYPRGVAKMKSARTCDLSWQRRFGNALLKSVALATARATLLFLFFFYGNQFPFEKLRNCGRRDPCFEGEAKFESCGKAFGATLTDVWWKTRNYFYRGHAMELIKSQQDL